MAKQSAARQLLLGADPELFVRHKGKLASAWDLIPGTKYKPYLVKDGAVQVDGMALEFNIDPADTAKKFANNIQSVMAQMKEMVPEYEFELAPVAHFGKELIDSQPEEAKILGCEPDYNAYTGKANPVPDVQAPFRTASGHVHIGWSDKEDTQVGSQHFKDCCLFARELDCTLGLMFVLLEEPNQRRELYGKAGCFRCKPYGMEYRTPSNVWLRSPELMEWVFQTVNETYDRLIKGNSFYAEHQQYGHWQHYVIDAINSHDKHKARIWTDHIGLGNNIPRAFVT